MNIDTYDLKKFLLSILLLAVVALASYLQGEQNTEMLHPNSGLEIMGRSAGF